MGSDGFEKVLIGTRGARETFLQIPDRKFPQALAQSSGQYEELYPSLAGATMIMNLPFVLQALVGSFAPLFPQSLQDRLKFVPAPYLGKLEDLTPLAGGASRKVFLGELKRLLKK